MLCQISKYQNRSDWEIKLKGVVGNKQTKTVGKCQLRFRYQQKPKPKIIIIFTSETAKKALNNTNKKNSKQQIQNSTTQKKQDKKIQTKIFQIWGEI